MTNRGYRNYHGILSRVHDGEDWWICDYCKEQGCYEQIHLTQCSHVYEACEHCGGSESSNECRPDCAGILAVLADPRVYIAGRHDPVDG